MPRKKKDLGQAVREGDIVILYAEKDCEGQVLGSGVVERIKPMHGTDQNMIWVPGFAAHHPDAVERVGSPAELIGKVRVLENDLDKKENEVSGLKKDLSSVKEKLDQALKTMDKVSAMLFIVDGVEMLDAKSIIRWIRETRSKFSLSAIRELGYKPPQAPVKKETKEE